MITSGKDALFTPLIGSVYVEASQPGYKTISSRVFMRFWWRAASPKQTTGLTAIVLKHILRSKSIEKIVFPTV